MQRRLRYQHAYGVILLVGCATGKLPYQAVWCEHHDDFLARCDGSYDSFQVKTSLPERGPWDTHKEPFVHSVGKFVQQESRFPGRMRNFRFVSNTDFLDSSDANKRARSPARLIAAVQAAAAPSDLTQDFLDELNSLAAACSTAQASMFQVLGRVRLGKGPSLDDFDASLSAEHVASLPECQSFTLALLHAVRDELIQLVADASSKRTDDPAKHWYCVGDPPENDPFLQAKRLLPTVVHDRGDGAMAGITKLAKIDFLLRYPLFLARVVDHVNESRQRKLVFDVQSHERDTVESRMIRFRYGPWDPRYRRWISLLDAKGLADARLEGRTVHVAARCAGSRRPGQKTPCREAILLTPI